MPQDHYITYMIKGNNRQVVKIDLNGESQWRQFNIRVTLWG